MKMKKLTKEEVITMLQGMLWEGGLDDKEREAIESAVKFLKGDEGNEC